MEIQQDLVKLTVWNHCSHSTSCTPQPPESQWRQNYFCFIAILNHRQRADSELMQPATKVRFSSSEGVFVSLRQCWTQWVTEHLPELHCALHYLQHFLFFTLCSCLMTLSPLHSGKLIPHSISSSVWIVFPFLCDVPSPWLCNDVIV